MNNSSQATTDNPDRTSGRLLDKAKRVKLRYDHLQQYQKIKIIPYLTYISGAA